MLKNDWGDIVEEAYDSLESEYRKFLEKNSGYFPDFENMFNAFKTLPLANTKYILFGQDPYPRRESAIGYAFIDAKVKRIFDDKNGLSKEVNRAVSLRNFVKMALVADGRLSPTDTSKEAIKKVNRDDLIVSIMDLKNNFEKNGILLLNKALVFTSKKDTRLHLKKWHPFIAKLLELLQNRDLELILFGNAAKDILSIKESRKFKVYHMEHPYNVSFVTNKEALDFFGKMELLKRQ
ncbi:uracil-DNA glycosylase family protein [Nitrosophilus alvini]|uniref:uracil-DNA glycosylase family protein n=1 Tax=Nitrosophilus alvini TaxID=2714855 RepID=UPI00190C3B53|nr:uracil-DNA glycosylase family protein [Nitrosophilus alvini]